MHQYAMKKMKKHQRLRELSNSLQRTAETKLQRVEMLLMMQKMMKKMRKKMRKKMGKQKGLWLSEEVCWRHGRDNHR